MHVTSGGLKLRMCCKGCFFNNKYDCKAKVVIWNSKDDRRTQVVKDEKFEDNTKVLLKFTYCDILWIKYGPYLFES